MSKDSPFFYAFEDSNLLTNEVNYINVTINEQSGLSAIFPLKNQIGLNYFPDSRIFNISSPFLMPQIKFSFNEDSSYIFIIGEVDKKISFIPDESIFQVNKCMDYMALYSIACGMYELHQIGIPFGDLSYKNLVFDQTGLIILFGYGINNRDGANKESIEKDCENFSNLVNRYFPEYENKNVKIEQIITTEVILDDLYFQQLERQRKLARERFKKLHFKNVDLLEISVKDAYPFLPSQYHNLPKSQVDMMIKNFQAQYSGTPEEAYKAHEKQIERNTRITQELMSKPSKNPDPNKPYDLSYRKILINFHPYSNKGEFFDCLASDLEGKPLTPMHHILFKNVPYDYIPINESIYNIDLEPLNNFLGYYKIENDFCLISQYSKFQNLSAIWPFEARLRNEPVISSIFIIGIAAAVYYLHKKGICADGINLKKILVDANTLHPVLIEYGNPELMHKTIDDDEKELLELCKDFYPNTFKDAEIPISEKIVKGEINLFKSDDVNDYRVKLLNKIGELDSIQFDLNQFSNKNLTKIRKEEELNKKSLNTVNEDFFIHSNSENNEKSSKDKDNDDRLIDNNFNNEIEKINDEEEKLNNEKNPNNDDVELMKEEEKNCYLTTNENVNGDNKKATISFQQMHEKADILNVDKEKIPKYEANNDEYYKSLGDLENISTEIPLNFIEKYACKKCSKPNETYENVFSSNDPLLLYQEIDNMIEALFNIRHSKKPAIDLYDAPYSSRQCQGSLLKAKFASEIPIHLLELIRYSGVNGIREIDEYYSQYNKNSSNIPISVAFQLLLDFSPHMSPPESTYTFNTKELIEYAKKGDCGALHKLGKILNNQNYIRKAAEWNYPPALYDIGRLESDKKLISNAAEKDYPLAKAFIKYGTFNETDKELVEKYINDFPNSEVTAEFYLYGIYVDKNEQKAVSILKDHKKYFKLGMYYLFYKEIRFSEACDAFKKGYEFNSDIKCKFAQIILDIYINEIYYDDLQKDMIKLAKDGLMQAKFFIGQRKEAAEKGLRTAMFEYGRDFYLGENGQKMCIAKGYQYIMAAHRLGHPYAYQLLIVSGRDPPLINIDDDLEKYDNDQLLCFSRLLYEGKYTNRDYKKSYECIELLVSRNFNKALYLKAYYLQYGIGVKQNANEALSIYESINSDDSLCQQALIYIKNNKDYKSGYSKLSTAINNGSVKAAFLLGVLKFDNKGIELLKLASQHGLIDADFFLKFLHPSENYDDQLELFKYTLNLAESGYDIGIIAIDSIIVKIQHIHFDCYSDVDFIERRSFLKKFLNIDTIFQGLGSCFTGFYDKDIFVYPNNIKGILISQKQILLDDAPKQYSQIFYVLSELNNPACLTYKANHMFKYSYDILPLQKSLNYYKKASKLGSITADLQLAHFYYRGILVNQDKNKAVFYAKKAAQKGVPFANDYLQYICDPHVLIPRQCNITDLGFNEMTINDWIESKNKHLSANDKNDEKSELYLSLRINSSSEKNENNFRFLLDDDDDIYKSETKDLDKNALIRNSLESKSHDINNADAIFEYGSALYYGDYGFEKDRDAAKKQFMRIRSNGSACFILQTKYDAPIKPIFRKRMTRKEEQFITSYSDKEENKSDKESENENEDSMISNVADFGNIINSVWPIISVVISIVKIFQGASLSTNNKSISFNSTINKIVDWSINLVRDIIDWTQVENISNKQTGMLMTFLVLFGFSFPMCSLKRSVPLFILCLLSSLIFVPLAFGIAMKKWILFGVFLTYYFVVWPFVWWISKRIKDKKNLNLYMILIYIPQTIVGFAYACFYVLIFKPNHGIVQTLMPYLKYLPIEKIEDFFSTDYQYCNFLASIEGDSLLNACISWGISWVLFDSILYWILGLCPIFYFVATVSFVVYIITLIVLIRGIYFVKYAMQILSYFAIFVYEKILELLLMPSVDLICDEESSLSNITKSIIIILGIILPLAFISFISCFVYHQSRTYHPAMFYGFLATTISVDSICDGYKMKYCFWPIVDNLYQIIFSLLTVYTSPINPCIFAFTYFIIIWIFRPNILVTDNIIISGEPFALFIFNLIIYINEFNTVPLFAGILLIILAILPAVLCVIYYYKKQKGHEFERLIHDMQSEVDTRRAKTKKPLQLIDVNNTWKIMKHAAIIEKSTFLFMKHFILVEPVTIEEDDFPEPEFIQKIIDIRSNVFIDVLCSFSMTIGLFLFYMQIGENI